MPDQPCGGATGRPVAEGNRCTGQKREPNRIHMPEATLTRSELQACLFPEGKVPVIPVRIQKVLPVTFRAENEGNILIDFVLHTLVKFVALSLAILPATQQPKPGITGQDFLVDSHPRFHSESCLRNSSMIFCFSGERSPESVPWFEADFER